MDANGIHCFPPSIQIASRSPGTAMRGEGRLLVPCSPAASPSSSQMGGDLGHGGKLEDPSGNAGCQWVIESQNHEAGKDLQHPPVPIGRAKHHPAARSSSPRLLPAARRLPVRHSGTSAPKKLLLCSTPTSATTRGRFLRSWSSLGAEPEPLLLAASPQGAAGRAQVSPEPPAEQPRLPKRPRRAAAPRRHRCPSLRLDVFLFRPEGSNPNPGSRSSPQHGVTTAQVQRRASGLSPSFSPAHPGSPQGLRPRFAALAALLRLMQDAVQPHEAQQRPPGLPSVRAPSRIGSVELGTKTGAPSPRNP
ncbi:translation initiation factor IF-2-like, partial [Lagopus leucura]|uniref:translation initiation factor IF-2-like n=1 Tax=Lagopus leucura TaxID=30410 RepID=UPI001C66F12A